MRLTALLALCMSCDRVCYVSLFLFQILSFTVSLYVSFKFSFLLSLFLSFSLPSLSNSLFMSLSLSFSFSFSQILSSSLFLFLSPSPLAPLAPVPCRPLVRSCASASASRLSKGTPPGDAGGALSRRPDTEPFGQSCSLPHMPGGGGGHANLSRTQVHRPRRPTPHLKDLAALPGSCIKLGGSGEFSLCGSLEVLCC